MVDDSIVVNTIVGLLNSNQYNKSLISQKPWDPGLEVEGNLYISGGQEGLKAGRDKTETSPRW